MTPQIQDSKKPLPLRRCSCGAPLVTRGLDPVSAVDICVVCQRRDHVQIDAMVAGGRTEAARVSRRLDKAAEELAR